MHLVNIDLFSAVFFSSLGTSRGHRSVAGMTTPVTTPFKQKVEERQEAVKAKPEGEPPAKKPCNPYEKQMQKLPAGDLTLVKELYPWVESKPNDILYIVAQSQKQTFKQL